MNGFCNHFVAIIFAGLLCCHGGCIAYHVTPAENSKASAIRDVGRYMQRISYGKRGGADHTSFYFMPCTSKYGQSFGTYPNGYDVITRTYRIKEYKYSDIKNVSVVGRPIQALWPLLGICDLTAYSTLEIEFKDNTTESLGGPVDSLWDLTPIWLIRPTWYELNRAAKAIERLRLAE